MRYQNYYIMIINRAASENRINIEMSTEQSVHSQHAESIKTDTQTERQQKKTCRGKKLSK